MTNTERVWRHLRAFPNSTCAQIATGLRWKPGPVREALRNLRARGDAVYSGNGSHGAWRVVTDQFIPLVGEHPASLNNLRANSAAWRKYLHMAQLARGASEDTAVPIHPPRVRDPWAAALFGDR